MRAKVNQETLNKRADSTKETYKTALEDAITNATSIDEINRYAAQAQAWGIKLDSSVIDNATKSVWQ
jgi:hypothetical protein